MDRPGPTMGRTPFIGSEALAAGALTRGQLRWNYDALHPDVYLAKQARHDLDNRAEAAWLWTRRRGIIAGRAAAARYTWRVPEPDAPVELITAARRHQPGVITRAERIDDDEIVLLDGMPVTSPARTALDLARHLPRELAMVHLDVLAAEANVTDASVYRLAKRYRGGRNVQAARELVWMWDGGADSPEESRLRMMLIDDGLPTPDANIILGHGPSSIRIPLGWPRFRVGVDYEELPLRLAEKLQIRGWIMILALPQRPVREVLSAAHNALQARRRW